MARILFVSSPIYGHVTPLALIAADLVRRGHDVTFITGPAFEDAVLATGARFAPTHGLASFLPEDLFPERDKIPLGPDQVNWDMKRIFIDPVPVQHELVQRELAAADGEPTILITEVTCLAGWPTLLGALGLRPAGTISIGIVVYMGTSADAGPYGLALLPDVSEQGRARNAEANAGYRAMMAPTQEHLEQVMGSMGTTESAPFFFDGLVTLPDRLLQLCPPGFEYPRSDAPAGLRFIGPIPSPAPEGTATERDALADLPDWWPEVERAERVVVVSQGTIANRDTTALFEPALRALADVDALVVLTTGSDDVMIDDVPVNARVGGFVPFDLLLPHTDVLVTNDGYGGSSRPCPTGADGRGRGHRGQARDRRARGVVRSWGGPGDGPPERSSRRERRPRGAGGPDLRPSSAAAAGGDRRPAPLRRGRRSGRRAPGCRGRRPAVRASSWPGVRAPGCTR
jgi:hypothetical protein